MRFKIIIFTLLLLVICIWVSGAIASPHYHHDEHQVVSPFDQKKNTLHCILKSHTHIGFCPHRNLSKNYLDELLIASDCGGKTSGTVPSNISGSKNQAKLCATRKPPVFIFLESLPGYSFLYEFYLFAPLDHPPRFN